MASNLENAICLEELASRYKVFFVDQFGVLHDGTNPYPGAVDAVRKLREMGRKVILLSNSGKRVCRNITRLERLGFSADTFDRMATSGEVAWHRISAEIEKGSMKKATKCLLLARDNDRSAIEGLDLTEVETSESADVILLSGSLGDSMTLDDYRKQLEPAARRGVTCLCTNPDKIMLTSVGPRFGAGRIAEEYEAMGGPVIWIGKPFPEMYDYALEIAGNPDATDVCCIGDSVEHDIVGGVNLGLGTALVKTGILSGMSRDDLLKLFDEHGVRPNFVLKSFAFHPDGENP